MPMPVVRDPLSAVVDIAHDGVVRARHGRAPCGFPVVTGWWGAVPAEGVPDRPRALCDSAAAALESARLWRRRGPNGWPSAPQPTDVAALAAEVLESNRGQDVTGRVLQASRPRGLGGLVSDVRTMQ